MKSLVAAVVLLAMILYMFSVCFTLAATEYLDEEENPYEGVADNFGTVYRSPGAECIIIAFALVPLRCFISMHSHADAP
eukprot:5566121-Amphidinium_carterae.2